MVWFLHEYMTTGETIALTMLAFVSKAMSLLCNMLSRFVIALLPRSKCLLILWPEVCSDFEAQEMKISHSFHFLSICFPWSDGTRCHDLCFFECWISSQLFHSPLSSSSRVSLIPLNFLPLKWYHLHIWGCWYFSQKSWFQLVSHPTQHFTWCTVHISKQGDNIQP